MLTTIWASSGIKGFKHAPGGNDSKIRHAFVKAIFASTLTDAWQRFRDGRILCAQLWNTDYRDFRRWLQTSLRFFTDSCKYLSVLYYCDSTHWGRVTHIGVGKLTIIGSHNGLSPERRQAIIWTNAGILLIGPLGTNFSEVLIEIQTFSLKENTFENVVCEMLFISSRPQCVNNVLRTVWSHSSYAWPPLLYNGTM